MSLNRSGCGGMATVSALPDDVWVGVGIVALPGGFDVVGLPIGATVRTTGWLEEGTVVVTSGRRTVPLQ